MTTLTFELPDRLAARLAGESDARDRLEAFLVGAVEAWLRRKQKAESLTPSWDDAFGNTAVDFVDQLIDDNHELFEELAGR